MSEKIKDLISKYNGVEVLGNKEEDDRYLILSDNTEKHEKDVLDEVVDSIRKELDEFLDDGEFDGAQVVIKDLSLALSYYSKNWIA